MTTGSVMGIIPGPFGAYYAASKHAIEGYSESLDHEVRTFGIRVAVIEPWATKTAIEANSPRGDRPIEAYAQTFAKYQAAFDEAKKAKADKAAAAKAAKETKPAAAAAPASAAKK